MSALVRQVEDDLEGTSVDLTGIEVLEPDLRSPEHPERIAIHLAPSEVDEAVVAPAVHVRAAEPTPPNGELDVSDEGLVAGRSRHDLSLPLQARVHIRVTTRLIRRRPA